MNEDPLSRRTFAAHSLTAALSGSLLTLVLHGCDNGSEETPANPVAPTEASDSALTLDLNDPRYAALKNVGGAVKVAVQGRMPLIVIQASAGTYLAFSSQCPHDGCEVNLPNSRGVLICPCHRSQFDLQGNKLAGPTPRGLVDFAVSTREGNLTVAL